VRRADVVVVGGGPAGSSAAWALVRRGLDVVVIDRQRFPRDKVCAGWITPPLVHGLELDLGAYARGRVLQPIRGFTVAMEDGGETAADFGRVVSYGILRRELDHFLLLRSGAELFTGEPLREIRRDGRRWVVNDRWSAPWVIGAGGHFCPVARRIGARPGGAEPMTIRASEMEVPLPPAQRSWAGVDPELPWIRFTRDLRGYGWVVRKGDWLNVGLGLQGGTAFPRRLEGFLDGLHREGRLPPDVAGALRGHAYLLHPESPRRVADDGLLLVGDAAGLAFRPSGEGIRPAVESGMLAAAAIAAVPGAELASVARRYEDSLIARFGPRAGRVRRGPADLLPGPWRAPVIRRLLASRAFARRVVVGRWFLRQDLPALDPPPEARPGRLAVAARSL
jgi:flavin-dependent dehydrogenase